MCNKIQIKVCIFQDESILNLIVYKYKKTEELIIIIIILFWRFHRHTSPVVKTACTDKVMCSGYFKLKFKILLLLISWVVESVFFSTERFSNSLNIIIIQI